MSDYPSRDISQLHIANTEVRYNNIVIIDDTKKKV